ncbi:MAG: response regulator transcription factor [Nitrosomonadales bacterium]|nr:response regulator transcription factor [Nitrosomonadales bacterium]
MQSITVAIVDDDEGRREKFERYLQHEQGIMVLRNVASSQKEMSVDRRLNQRSSISDIDNVIASVRRLNPRILLANLKQCTDADCALLMSLRRECPNTFVVMLADAPSLPEDQVVQALESGARGYLNIESELPHLSRAVHVIDRGEAWVPRKMLGKIMNTVLQWCHGGSIEAQLDPAS